MGERLSTVKMRAFRGVRHEHEVELPDGKSAVLFGDNATGKSTVADAVEWYFTDTIDFLRHEGRVGAVRHVGAGDDVTTSVHLESTGTLGGTRVLDGALAPDVREAGRETFLLRGRTLTAFVERTKGEKWRALSSILGLDEVDKVRLDLQTARNQLRAVADDAANGQRLASEALRSKVDAVTEQGILKALANLCRNAEVAVPTTLEEALTPGWSAAPSTSAINSTALDLARLKLDLDAWSPESVSKAPFEGWNELLTSQGSMTRAALRFYQAADALLAETGITDAACPLCGHEVNEEVLRRQVRAVLDDLATTAEAWERASDDLRRAADQLDRMERDVEELKRRAERLGIEAPAPQMSRLQEVGEALDQPQPVDLALAADLTQSAMGFVRRLREAVDSASIPSTTSREAMLVEIGVLVEQVQRWHRGVQQADRARAAWQMAEKVFTAYAASQRRYFKEVLQQISGRVAEIYSKLHPGEDLADVSVEPWGQKGVELAVSFHGIRQKPPHGVLSESHLNSLAVALFLGMAETFNQRLEFLVLDDVVNSFDMNHRGELARLLAHEFSHRQLIVLTHDQLFFERLARLAPSWKRIEFTSWDFDEGPRTAGYQGGDMLERAGAAIAAGDRMSAATKGRRALEEILQEICEGLQAPLPFRRGMKNDRREVGELMKGVRRGLKDLSKSMYDELRLLLGDLEADVAAALNPEAHASRVHPSVAEVQSALDRVTVLDARWSCAACSTRVWHRGTPEACRCRCGESRFPPPPGLGRASEAPP